MIAVKSQPEYYSLRISWAFVTLLAYLLMSPSSRAQYENNTASVVLDNTEYSFDADNFRPTTADSTRGGSSFVGPANPNFSAFILGDLSNETRVARTVFFDHKILPTGSQYSLILRAYDEFGITVESPVPQTTDGVWRTHSVRLPAQTLSFSIDIEGGVFASNQVFVDHIRYGSGGNTGGGGTGGGTTNNPKDCNAGNEFSEDDLSRAVDNTFFPFFTSDRAFFSQQEPGAFDRDAAASPGITDPNGFAFIGVGVVAGVSYDLSWRWKVSSHPEDGEMRFIVYDENFNLTSINFAISGDSGWREESRKIPPGLHYLVWFYGKYGSRVRGEDRGWLDKVNIGGFLDERCAPPPLSPIYDLLLNQ